jgi:hypothetical protein
MISSPPPGSEERQGRVVQPAQLHRALDDRDAHCRQRELVRLSLLACPTGGHPTHQRWAA